MGRSRTSRGPLQPWMGMPRTDRHGGRVLRGEEPGLGAAVGRCAGGGGDDTVWLVNVVAQFTRYDRSLLQAPIALLALLLRPALGDMAALLTQHASAAGCGSTATRSWPRLPEARRLAHRRHAAAAAAAARCAAARSAAPSRCRLPVSPARLPLIPSLHPLFLQQAATPAVQPASSQQQRGRQQRQRQQCSGGSGTGGACADAASGHPAGRP